LEGDVAVGFLLAVMGNPDVAGLLSAEHFSVDGKLPRCPCCQRTYDQRNL
jgi:hypothetical protein